MRVSVNQIGQHQLSALQGTWLPPTSCSSAMTRLLAVVSVSIAVLCEYLHLVGSGELFSVSHVGSTARAHITRLLAVDSQSCSL